MATRADMLIAQARNHQKLMIPKMVNEHVYTGHDNISVQFVLDKGTTRHAEWSHEWMFESHLEQVIRYRKHLSQTPFRWRLEHRDDFYFLFEELYYAPSWEERIESIDMFISYWGQLCEPVQLKEIEYRLSQPFQMDAAGVR